MSMAVKKRESKKIPKYAQEEIEAYLDNNNFNKSLNDIKIRKTFKNDKQQDLYNKILKNRIIFVRGSAGTGKTHIALMAALECLISENFNINQIQITKPIVEVSSSLGHLPGEIEDKTSVFFNSFYSVLDNIIGRGHADFLKRSNMINETIVNYIRGNTFGSTDNFGKPIGHFCILDEAQNLSITEIKTYISRISTDTKLIILGDSDQVDIKLKYNEQNGFDHCFQILQGLDDIEFVEFTEDDIIREKILIDIMKRFKANKPL